MGSKKTGRNKIIKRVILLIAELMAMALLIAAAFFAPQVIFQVQDYILCANTSLSKREAMDVETLSTTYEKSLKQRMLNFTEGLGAGENYYVVDEDLDISQEIIDYVSDIISQYMVYTYVEAGIIPIEYYKNDYTVNKWKKYVIYSDDYTKGVSFILWYTEIQDKTGMVMKLLTDGEDGTIYALKTETNGLLKQNETLIYKENNASISEILDLRWIFLNEDYLAELWAYYALYYEALSRTETQDYLVDSTERGVNTLWEREYYEYDSEGCAMRFHLPYGNISVEFLVDIGKTDLGVKYITYRYPDFVMGIRQIYERIPEFA